MVDKDETEKGIDLNSKPTIKLAANLDEAMPLDIK
jgi:hypothetical protein